MIKRKILDQRSATIYHEVANLSLIKGCSGFYLQVVVPMEQRYDCKKNVEEFSKANILCSHGIHFPYSHMSVTPNSVFDTPYNLFGEIVFTPRTIVTDNCVGYHYKIILSKRSTNTTNRIDADYTPGAQIDMLKKTLNLMRDLELTSVNVVDFINAASSIIRQNSTPIRTEIPEGYTRINQSLFNSSREPIFSIKEPNPTSATSLISNVNQALGSVFTRKYGKSWEVCKEEGRDIIRLNSFYIPANRLKWFNDKFTKAGYVLGKHFFYEPVADREERFILVVKKSITPSSTSSPMPTIETKIAIVNKALGKMFTEEYGHAWSTLDNDGTTLILENFYIKEQHRSIYANKLEKSGFKPGVHFIYLSHPTRKDLFSLMIKRIPSEDLITPTITEESEKQTLQPGAP